MGGKRTEACGRCSVSTVIDATEAEEESNAGPENPFEGERIEVEESTMRSVVRHEVLASRVRNRLDGVAGRLIFG